MIRWVIGEGTFSMTFSHRFVSSSDEFERDWRLMLLTMTRYKRTLVCCMVFILVLSGCREIGTTVKVGNGPSFSLKGSGRLASFRIYGPEPGHKIATPFDTKSLVWRVQPAEGYFKGARRRGDRFRRSISDVSRMATPRRHQTGERPMRC